MAAETELRRCQTSWREAFVEDAASDYSELHARRGLVLYQPNYCLTTAVVEDGFIVRSQSRRASELCRNEASDTRYSRGVDESDLSVTTDG